VEPQIHWEKYQGCIFILGWLIASPNQAVGVELRNAVHAALYRELFIPEWLLVDLGMEELIPPEWVTSQLAQLYPRLFDQTTEEAPD